MKKLLIAAALAAGAMQAHAVQTYSWFIHWNGLGDQSGTLTFDEAGKADNEYYYLNWWSGRREFSATGFMGTEGAPSAYLWYRDGEVRSANFCGNRCDYGVDLPYWLYFLNVSFSLDQRGTALNAKRMFNPDGTFKDVYTTGVTTFVEGSVPLAIPEPDTYAMLLAGLGVLAWAAKRRNN